MAEIIVLIGIPGSGKSTFYEKKFANSHERVSLDIVGGRRREDKLLEKLVLKGSNIVIDNTNPSMGDRQKYIHIAKRNGYLVNGYLIQSIPDECKRRNNMRIGKKKIPDIAIDCIYSVLVPPKLSEGFDKIFYVRIEDEFFIVEEIKDDLR
ncbi:MAG: ATP-binding protein [Saprospiraceae bacterium]|nr:ATP-binding protein [Saprospiraceae bacterium]